MTYTMTRSEASNSTDYFKKINDREWLKVTLYKDGWVAIQDEVYGGDVESTDKEFRIAYHTALTRFRTLVYPNESAKVTETRDGVFTEIEFKPIK